VLRTPAGDAVRVVPAPAGARHHHEQRAGHVRDAERVAEFERSIIRERVLTPERANRGSGAGGVDGFDIVQAALRLGGALVNVPDGQGNQVSLRLSLADGSQARDSRRR
jgi:hypothetical protein